MLLVVDACQRAAAASTRLSEPVVDEIDLLVALAVLAQLERATQVLVDRGSEFGDLVVAEPGRERERGKPCPPEDLIRVGPADARQCALIP